VGRLQGPEPGRESITLTDFNVKTVPEGLENFLSGMTIDPTEVPNFSGTQMETPVTITATDNCGDQQTELSTVVAITIVNETFENSVSSSLQLAGSEKLKKWLQKVMDKLKFNPICEPSASLDLSGSTIEYYLCCPNNGCVKKSNKKQGQLSASAGISCDFPFAAFPALALNLQASAGLNFSVDFQETCNDDQVCFQVQAVVSFGGGLALGIPADLIDASIVIVGTVTLPPLKYCTPPGDLVFEGKVCFKADIIGTVEFCSFYKQSVNFALIGNKCYQLWE
jgi:hypothetical protein